MRAGLGVVALAVAASAAACRQARVDPEGAREAREAMLFVVASQFREPYAALGVLEFEPVTFEDACLEIRRRGACAAQRTPGYRLRVSRRGELYEYRAPAASPADAALASAPDPRIGPPALAWTWESAPGGCQTLLVSADVRAAVGWCEGAIAEVNWMEGGFSPAEWRYLDERFAPFERTTAEHRLSFAGRGTEPPAPEWQDAVERWAALRWSELRSGRSGAAHGRALAFRKPVRDRAGYCDVLEVTEYAVAYLGRSQCEGGGGEPGKAVWLSDPLWKQLNGWLTEWSPYTDDVSGIYFFGTGAHRPSPEEVSALEDWTDRAMAHVAYTDKEAWPKP
jgi:hypothetical protein